MLGVWGMGTALAKGKALVKHGHQWIGRFPWAVKQRGGDGGEGGHFHANKWLRDNHLADNPLT